MSLTDPTNALDIQDERLSQLIGLKRLERPDAAFWTAFQQEYKSKQLASLVKIQPRLLRIAKKCLTMLRGVSLISIAGTASLIAITTVGVTYFTQIEKPSVAPNATIVESEPLLSSEPLFVVDTTKTQSVSEMAIQAKPFLPATYQVSVMAKSKNTSAYQLISSPIILSPAQSIDSVHNELESKAGATIIRTGREF